MKGTPQKHTRVNSDGVPGSTNNLKTLSGTKLTDHLTCPYPGRDSHGYGRGPLCAISLKIMQGFFEIRRQYHTILVLAVIFMGLLSVLAERAPVIFRVIALLRLPGNCANGALRCAWRAVGTRSADRLYRRSGANAMPIDPLREVAGLPARSITRRLVCRCDATGSWFW